MKTASFLIIFLLMTTVAGAHPPKNMELSYEMGVLIISMEHVTQDPREHRIRKVTIFKNGQEVKEMVITQQTSPQDLYVEYPIDLQSGDEVEVKAICSEAGFERETLIFSPTSK